MRRRKLCKWAIRNTSFKWFHDVDDNSNGEDGDDEDKDEIKYIFIDYHVQHGLQNRKFSSKYLTVEKLEVYC